MNKKEHTESGNLRESNPPPMTGFQKHKSRQKPPKSTLPWGMEPVDVMEEIEKRGLDVSQLEIWQTIDEFSSRESPAPSEPNDSNPSRGDPANQSTKLGTPPPIPKRKLELMRDSALPSNIPEVEVVDEDGPITIPAPAVAAPVKAEPAKEKSSEPAEEPSSPDSRNTKPAPSPNRPQEGLAATVLMEPPADLELSGPKRSRPKSKKGVIIAVSIVVPVLLLAAAAAFLLFRTDVVAKLGGSPVKPPVLGKAPQSKALPTAGTATPKPAIQEPAIPSSKPATPTETAKADKPLGAPPENESSASPSPSNTVDEPEPVSAPVSLGDTVTITVTGLPKEAVVLVNGKSEQRQFSVPKSEKSMKVEASAPGYQSRVKRVVPTRDKRINLRLKKE